MSRIYLERDSHCSEHDDEIVTVMIEGRSAVPKPLELGYVCLHSLEETCNQILGLIRERKAKP